MRFLKIKKKNKDTLSGYLRKTFQITFPPTFLLDCQVKRFHEYKRQLLNIFHVITLYNRIREGKIEDDFTPRAVLFSGKSAPGYAICKLMIKLINNVSSVVSSEPLAKEKLRILFVPNYGVTLGEHIIPAAELSEQISTAGYEASGTGNMKFALNGALTIGTLDGANIEMRDEIGKENFFLFGHTAEELLQMRTQYTPRVYYEQNPELRQVINQLLGGYFSDDDTQLFHPIVKSLLEHDRFFVLADYVSYIKCQERISKAYRDRKRWARMALLNVARCGKFSSDRAIREYAEKIWKVSPVSLSPQVSIT